MKVYFSAKAEKGRREYNDDRIIADGKISSGEFTEGEAEIPFAAAVCDGCGGYSGGGKAAGTVLKTLDFFSPGELSDRAILEKALELCKKNVYALKEIFPGYKDMCTTAAGAVFCDNHVNIFHAGDSRVYRYDGISLTSMTRDHSLVNELTDKGLITEEEARRHPDRNIISRCIGNSCPAPEIYISHSPLLPGETYLLCSDGLTEAMRDSDIKAILDMPLSDKEKTEKLILSALEKGSDDNISVCLIRGEGELKTEEEETPFIID